MWESGTANSSPSFLKEIEMLIDKWKNGERGDETQIFATKSTEYGHISIVQTFGADVVNIEAEDIPRLLKAIRKAYKFISVLTEEDG